MTEEITNNPALRGDAYLAQLNKQDVPPWAKGMSLILTGLIGFILALGLNVGDVVTNYMSSRNQLETAALSQTGQVEVNALTGLIDANKGMTAHIADLIVSINNLINENKVLVEENRKLNTENAELKIQSIQDKETITNLNKEVQDARTRLELQK